MKKSKATVDEHLDRAFASLDDFTVRELEATAEAIGSRRHPLFEFASIFRGVASAREGGWGRPSPLSPSGDRLPRRRGARRTDRGCAGALLAACARCAGRAASVTPCRLPQRSGPDQREGQG